MVCQGMGGRGQVQPMGCGKGAGMICEGWGRQVQPAKNKPMQEKQGVKRAAPGLGPVAVFSQPQGCSVEVDRSSVPWFALN